MRGWPNVANVNAVVTWCCPPGPIIGVRIVGSVGSQISDFGICLMGVTEKGYVWWFLVQFRVEMMFVAVSSRNDDGIELLREWSCRFPLGCFFSPIFQAS